MKKKHSSQIHILLDKIEVMSIMNCSGIFTGENMQANWRSYQKANMGFGLIAGVDNHSDSNINIVHDPDIVDMPIQDSSNS
ncbi:MAG: hypothetical protein U9Q88_17585 [Bacillota bacterium]|uniref:hypothetical protein n=1 Tax=Bacillus sp. RO2 TaxID=2723913 RepID=UPI00145E2C3A|nr:hypothetical protein [Bacillus sp. RO2]MEA3321805.1 hypothetical protein [Bacillota bacterium]NMH73208.1 hypothetical protein [Bacillus sp. RO2]